MIINNQSSSTVIDLITAKNYLSATNWIRGAYFKIVDGAVCTCAHGALQKKTNPQVSLFIGEIYHVPYLATQYIAKANQAAEQTLHRTMITSAVIAHRARVDKLEERFGDRTELRWNGRPNIISTDYIYEYKNYGNLDAHYLLDMVGLTSQFNDHPDTTFYMVKDKFNQAIKLATTILKLK